MISSIMIGPSLDSQGGMTTVEQNILKSFKSEEVHFAFIPTYTEGNKVKRAACALKAFIDVSKQIKQCDLIHVHMASRGSYERKRIFIRLASNQGKPVILHLHGSEFRMWFDEECSEKKRDQIRDTFKRCSRIIVLSEEWKDYLKERSICPSDRVTILHNAVYVPQNVSPKYEKFQVLFMGRLDDRKCPDLLIRASRHLLEVNPKAHFVFAGDGNIEVYKSLAYELGVSNNCKFLGWVDGEAKDNLYRSSSVYCLPSRNEGMPMSVLEAMSYGLVTLSTPVGGMPQVIEDNIDGLFFEVDDEDKLVELLLRLNSSSSECRRLGQAARKKIIDKFSMSAYRDTLFQIYEEVIA